MHFGDVDETNGGKTNSLRPRDLKRIDRAAASVQTGFFFKFSFQGHTKIALSKGDITRILNEDF